MQAAAPAPSPPRLHWIPVEPSWLVAIGLVLLAVLPHQIPPTLRRLLSHPIGAILLLLVAAAIGVWYKKPVLGAALLLLVAAVQIRDRTHPREGFAAPILVKDRRPKGSVDWFVEDTLGEDPHGIQERTEEGGFLYDEVEGPSRPWFVESTLNERPLAVQERTVTAGDPHDTPYETGHAVQPVA